MDVLARSRAEEMIVCDLDGYTLEALHGFTPALEVKAHSCIYKLYPRVQAIAHTHARFVAMMTVIGAVVGLAGAVAVSRVLSGVLFGVSPFDPIGIGAAALFVLAVAFAAGFVPGRKATRQHPLAALHYE